MWTALGILLMSVNGGAPGDLQITDTRTTHGYMGATREKKAGALPGDDVFFSFNIKNLTIGKDGAAEFSLYLEVLDPKKDILYSQGPRNHKVQTYFGGDSVPCHAHMALPPNAIPGIYAAKVTVTDKASGKKVTFLGGGKVLPADFGIVRVGTFGEGGNPRSPVGVVGEIVQVRFSLIGFTRDKSGESDVDVTLKILDEKNEPVKAKAQSHHVKQVLGMGQQHIPMQFGLTLDRPGNFTLEINARDIATGKNSQVRLPLRVLEPQ